MTTGVTGPLLLWALMQALTVVGVANYRRHLPRDRQLEAPPGIVVIAAVRGAWPGAEAFVAALLDQQAASPRLLLAIDSREDPAWPTLDALRARYPDRVELVVAGVSGREGQKIHKLRAAVAALRSDDRYLVFVDTDMVPPPTLVGRLLFPVVRGKAPIATGYRLLLPPPRRPLLALVAAADWQVATLPRPPQGTLPWAGALAMARETFEALDVAGEWEGRLSDDLTVARLARAQGVGIRPVRDLLLASPIDGSAGAAVAFGVRQYRHLFWNLPGVWLAAAAVVTAQAAGWAWALAGGGWPAVAIGYAAAWLRAAFRWSIVRAIVPRERIGAVLAWDLLLPFAASFLHAACALAGPCSRTIRWGAFAYRMAREGRVTQVDRLGPT